MKMHFSLAALVAASCAASGAFEKIAYIDSFDYSASYETETVEGSRKIVDNVLKTGANINLWRNQSGSVPCYPSPEEQLPLKEPPLDIRRIPLNEPIRGWVRYDDCWTDPIRDAADWAAERKVVFGIHVTTEENHWESWTLGPWNLEHPQFWCCTRGGTPWPGRVSLFHPEVRDHKLRLIEELLAYRPKMICLDMLRSGGWTPAREYTVAVTDEWRRRYACEPPVDAADPRWIELVEEYTRAYYRGIRERARKTGTEMVMTVEHWGAEKDYNLVSRAVDWRRLLREDIVDSIAVACVKPDWNDPWGSTERLYRLAISEAKAARATAKVYLPIMSYNFSGRPGYPEYAKRCKMTQAEVVTRLMKMSRAVGADGITMEVVDLSNYSPEVCAAIRDN